MATGTISSVNYDNWQLVATNTTSSGTTSTFSFSGFKRLLLTWDNISSSASLLVATFNTSTSGYVGGGILPGNNGSNTNSTAVVLDPYSTSGDRSGYLYVENTASSAPKTYQGWGNDDSFAFTIGGAWINTSAVTSLEVKFTNGAAFTGGSFSVYGIAA